MGFEFKIIGVEKGTHSLTSEKGDEWDVDTLPDAQLVAENATVEKRVIELTDDVINDLKKYKYFRVPFSMFIKDVGNGMPYSDYGLRLEDLADWYLHPELVEFVAKKEPQYAVSVRIFDEEKLVVHYERYGERMLDFIDEEDWKDDEGCVYLDESERQFTKAEADELVAGLTALKARKVKVEE